MLSVDHLKAFGKLTGCAILNRDYYDASVLRRTVLGSIKEGARILTQGELDPRSALDLAIVRRLYAKEPDARRLQVAEREIRDGRGLQRAIFASTPHPY
ncbi:MAG: hypothetical protein ACKVPX_04160 [Myxococcaceae bacterium]